jgi:hypothetical protein
MNFWRAAFLAAFVLGLALGVLLALIALHAFLFFGAFTPSTEARITYAVQDAVPNLFGEKLKTGVTGVSFLDEILEKAHGACPNQIGEN